MIFFVLLSSIALLIWCRKTLHSWKQATPPASAAPSPKPAGRSFILGRNRGKTGLPTRSAELDASHEADLKQQAVAAIPFQVHLAKAGVEMLTPLAIITGFYSAATLYFMISGATGERTLASLMWYSSSVDRFAKWTGYLQIPKPAALLLYLICLVLTLKMKAAAVRDPGLERARTVGQWLIKYQKISGKALGIFSLLSLFTIFGQEQAIQGTLAARIRDTKAAYTGFQKAVRAQAEQQAVEVIRDLLDQKLPAAPVSVLSWSTTASTAQALWNERDARKHYEIRSKTLDQSIAKVSNLSDSFQQFITAGDSNSDREKSPPQDLEMTFSEKSLSALSAKNPPASSDPASHELLLKILSTFVKLGVKSSSDPALKSLIDSMPLTRPFLDVFKDAFAAKVTEWIDRTVNKSIAKAASDPNTDIALFVKMEAGEMATEIAPLLDHLEPASWEQSTSQATMELNELKSSGSRFKDMAKKKQASFESENLKLLERINARYDGKLILSRERTQEEFMDALKSKGDLMDMEKVLNEVLEGKDLAQKNQALHYMAEVCDRKDLRFSPSIVISVAFSGVSEKFADYHNSAARDIYKHFEAESRRQEAIHNYQVTHPGVSEEAAKSAVERAPYHPPGFGHMIEPPARRPVIMHR